uniref:RRM domain-containing protein n=1 Tax=Rhodotorula toruloides TaxID=5286 RepID=A0A0K3CPR4_RHOTO
MFIGGLNWDTTDETLKMYFEQFGPITHCTIMRDSETGRSRGFAFLTFENPSSVNAVMAREHHLDGKTIDPKRAIPRSETAKTDKLFVRALPATCTQESFRQFWRQFGPITDATLMMDKETGRHRGFGFVNYETREAVEKVLNSGPHYMDGQMVRVLPLALHSNA